MPERPIDIRQVARALSAVENRRPQADAIVREAYRQARTVPVLGIAGPPGAGKSTLLDHLAIHWAQAGERVAVIAVDPSSPHTGGAVLGDRFRMDRASAHPRVFVRSLSSRGQVGGLSRAVQDVVTVMGALGFDRVLVETVGSGQADLDVALLADCVAVVSVPGLGDQVQAAKAGILEIGDVHVVNKKDLPGADTVAGHLQANLDLIYPGQAGVNGPDRARAGLATGSGNPSVHRRHGMSDGTTSFWRPPIVRVSARDGTGIDALADAIDGFLAWQRETGREAQRRAERLRSHILRLAAGRLLALASDECASIELSRLAEGVASGSTTPDQAAGEFVEVLLESWYRRAAEPRCVIDP
jgi:LAO/AO transport system kinase